MLDELKKSYPLPTHWEMPEYVNQSVQIEDLSIHIVGIAAQAEGVGATGSAASPEEPPVRRAYFELLERIAILTQMGEQHGQYSLRSRDGEHLFDISSELVFPQSSSKDYSFAKSNGVALGSSFADAAQRASLEREERDRVLRHWYSQQPPQQIEAPEFARGHFFQKNYEFFFAEFSTKQDAEDNISVCGAFGFPRDAKRPYIYGLGAAETRQTALKKAEGEIYQTLGFLWNEEISVEEPSFSPSPMYHQEFYSYIERALKVRNWLEGNGARQEMTEPNQIERRRGFVDLTPDFLKGELSVVKSIDTSQMEMAFGRFRPPQFPTVDDDLLIHPIP